MILQNIFFYYLLQSILKHFLLLLPFATENRNQYSSTKKRRSINKQVIFDGTKFKLKYVLGSGSFGVVTYAEYFDENNENSKNGFYALKSISKADVVDTGKILLCIMCTFNIWAISMILLFIIWLINFPFVILSDLLIFIPVLSCSFSSCHLTFYFLQSQIPLLSIYLSIYLFISLAPYSLYNIFTAFNDIASYSSRYNFSSNIFPHRSTAPCYRWKKITRSHE